jgi:hypothetical protein
LTISGRAEANARVELFNGTTLLGATTASSTGTFSLDVALAASVLPHSITARATDIAGNVGAASAVLAITVDTTIPAAPTALDLAAVDDKGLSNTDDITSQTSALTISGTAEAGATVELFEGTNSLGTATANAFGAFSLDVTLAFRNRSITAKATDKAGNVGDASTALGITVTQVNLADVANGTGGFVINGAARFNYSGGSVSSAGDVNGDGFDDLIVGAGRVNLSYVVFGKANTASVNLSNIASGTGGFVINGAAAGDSSGGSVSSAGDVNGDGLDDLIVGATLASPNGIRYAGASYVVFGKADGAAVNLSAIASGTGGFVINGDKLGDRSGFSVSSAGDVNGDGLDDLIVGAYYADPNGDRSGASYVVFGKAGGTKVELSDIASGTSTLGFVMNGAAIYDRSGFSVSSAGDVNNDGLDDLIVGAKNADPNGTFNGGASYVVFGKTDGTKVELSTIASGDGTKGFVINGAASNNRSGQSVSSAGDVNGDGFDDLIVGAHWASPNGNSSGASYVVFGKAGGTKVELSDIASGTSTLGFVINGATAVDYSGYSVSSAGDVNGDGLDDLIVGAWGADPNGNSFSGASYVVFGKTDGTKVELSAIVSGDGTKGFVINGAVLSDQSARSVSSAGDVNGDGFDDLIVGAALADPNGNSNSGSSYVVFGGNFTGSVTQLGTTGNDILSGTAGDDVIFGGRGDDVITGNGGIDRLAGGTGNDTLIISNANFGRVDGGADIDTLRLAGTNGFTLDLSDLAAVAIKDIEVIDLVAGSLNNTLTVTQQTLMNLSTTTNRLTVLGGSGDTVNATGFTFGSAQTENSINYTTYTNGLANLWVQNGVTVVI